MVIDAMILHKGLVGFGRISHLYEERVQITEARAEVAEEPQPDRWGAGEEERKRESSTRGRTQFCQREVGCIGDTADEEEKKKMAIEQEEMIFNLEMEIDFYELSL